MHACRALAHERASTNVLLRYVSDNVQRNYTGHKSRGLISVLHAVQRESVYVLNLSGIKKVSGSVFTSLRKAPQKWPNRRHRARTNFSECIGQDCREKPRDHNDLFHETEHIQGFPNLVRYWRNQHVSTHRLQYLSYLYVDQNIWESPD